MSDNIKVAIKVRPLVEREVDEYQTLQWNVCGNTITPIDSKRRGEGGFQFGKYNKFFISQFYHS